MKIELPYFSRRPLELISCSHLVQALACGRELAPCHVESPLRGVLVSL